MSRTKILIMGAAAADFLQFQRLASAMIHLWKWSPSLATQIPGIEGRRYPPELAGTLYP